MKTDYNNELKMIKHEGKTPLNVSTQGGNNKIKNKIICDET